MFLTNIQLGTDTAPGSPFTVDRFINSGGFKLTFTGTAIAAIETSGTGIKITDGRSQNDKGANIVAANDLTLGVDGNTFTVTGNTQINAITSTNWQSGSWVILETTGTPLFKHNTAGGAGTLPMKLAGSVDFQAAADDAILFYNNGLFWHELARKLAASGAITANNALTMSTPTNVQLGGALIKNTTITGNFTLSIINSNNSTASLTVINNGSGAIGIDGFGSTYGIQGRTTSGVAIYGNATTSGGGGYFQTVSGLALVAEATPSSTNTSISLIEMRRNSSGSPAAGMGAYLSYVLEASDNSQQPSASIHSTWVNATVGTRSAALRNFVTANAATEERFSIFPYKTLTESSATAFVRINIPISTVTGGEILVTVEANDATDYQSRTLRFIWSAVNKGGTITANVQTPEESVAVSAGTLTVTIDTNDAGSGNLDFRANAVSSLTQTVLRCSYQVFKNIGTGIITPQ